MKGYYYAVNQKILSFDWDRLTELLINTHQIRLEGCTAIGRTAWTLAPSNIVKHPIEDIIVAKTDHLKENSSFSWWCNFEAFDAEENVAHRQNLDESMEIMICFSWSRCNRPLRTLEVTHSHTFFWVEDRRRWLANKFFFAIIVCFL